MSVVGHTSAGAGTTVLFAFPAPTRFRRVRAANDLVKINQCDHMYIEDCDVHGAGDNAIDFVGVQYFHVHGCRIHDAGDWCMYASLPPCT